MPIYEYECKKCEGVFEIFQGFNDQPATKCEECGGKLKRLISLSSFHLKGSGWYETDYGKKKVTEPKQLKDHADADGDAPKTSESSQNGSVPSDNRGNDGADTGGFVYDSIKSDTKRAKKKD